MRTFGFAIATMAAMFSAPSVASTTVTWDDTACAPLATCGNGSVVSQEFGDTPEVDLSYSGDIRYWSGLYSNSSAIYSGDNLGEIRIAPLSGLTLTLLSVDFGGWPNIGRAIAYSVFSDDLTQTLASGTVNTDPTALTTVNFGIQSTSALRLRFGPDGFNGGIQNLRFTTSAPAIPEPGTWMLMILGLGAVGFALRRRQNISSTFQFA